MHRGESGVEADDITMDSWKTLEFDEFDPEMDALKSTQFFTQCDPGMVFKDLMLYLRKNKYDDE